MNLLTNSHHNNDCKSTYISREEIGKEIWQIAYKDVFTAENELSCLSTFDKVIGIAFALFGVSVKHSELWLLKLKEMMRERWR